MTTIEPLSNSSANGGVDHQRVAVMTQPGNGSKPRHSSEIGIFASSVYKMDGQHQRRMLITLNRSAWHLTSRAFAVHVIE